MIEKRKYDALVVGARCGGAATAMLMARQGLDVLMIDRGEYGSDTLSTHALMRGAVLQLHRWGLLPRLIEAGTPPVRRTNFHYGDEAVSIAIKPSHGVDALYAPRRTVLDRLLADAAWEAGAELRYGHVLTALKRRPDGRVSGAVVTAPDGRHVEVDADLVVGADGLGSRVAQLVEAPILHAGRHMVAAIYGHWSGLAAEGYGWHYRPGVAAGVIPTNAGQTCVFVAVPPERFRDELRRDVEGSYHRVLVELSSDLAEAVAAARLPGRFWAFAGRKGFLRRPVGPGWALVGDAGYFKDPLTAHGMTDALRDAEMLARAAATGTPDAFEDYARTRDALSLPLFEATDAIASFEWDLDTLRVHHANLNAAMKREVEHMAGFADVPRPSRSAAKRDARTAIVSA